MINKPQTPNPIKFSPAWKSPPLPTIPKVFLLYNVMNQLIIPSPLLSPPVNFFQPLFVVRDRVLFPGGLLRLSVGRPGSVQLVESLLSKRDDYRYKGGGPTILLAIFTQRWRSKDGLDGSETRNSRVSPTNTEDSFIELY